MYDWNGNDRNDSFDNYIAYKVSHDDSNVAGGTCKTKADNGKIVTCTNKVIYDANKDSDGVVILKCVLVIAVCLGGFLAALSSEGELVGVIALFGAAWIGIKIFQVGQDDASSYIPKDKLQEATH